jgi:fructokinase
VRIGLDLGGTKIEGILLDGSREIARLRVPTPRDDYDRTLDAVRQLVVTLETHVPPSLTAATVGLGIPGALDPETGLVKNANSTWLIARPLQRDLETALARPVRIANDANCFAVSEATDGAAARAQVVFGIILGTGVGGGIAIDGRVVTGRHAIAGEWGHNPLPWPEGDEAPGPECYCGRAGCIETFLSGPGMSRDHRQHTGETCAPEAIAQRAAAGDDAAAATLARYEGRLARALATIINVLDPDVIVVGGGLSNLERFYLDVPQIWTRFVFGAVIARRDATAEIAQAPVRTRLVPAMHGDSSGVRGAAWLWPAGE